ncbi:ABC transporter transmembrane domain-containing protein [uncultured Roseobacter sp.]|uniref:ABC transporter transmembrane domain-containing protein n=1 Tax=uncultured Roseobacter sp. TaxID=114847 RepID=UPI00262DCF5D|nr:ABC transporter transmembrane domain-containing protein [uncultured Roseobacter sp.]
MNGNIVRPPRLGAPVIVTSLCVNLLALALPLVVLQVFDRVIPFESYSTLSLLFIGLCIVAVLDFALKWARLILLGHEGEKFELDLGERFLDRSLNADPSAYDKSSTGDHLERLNALAQLRDYYCGQGRLSAIDLPFSGIFIVMIALIGGWLVLVPLTGLALLYAFKFVLQRAQAPVFEKRKSLDGRRYSFLIECLSQIMTVKADTMEPQLLRRYEVLQNQSVDISEKLIRLSGLSQSFGALFSQAAVAATGLFGAYLVINGQIGVAELAACMLLNGRTVQPLLKMLSHWAQSESVEAALARVNETGNLPQRTKRARPDGPLKGHLVFDTVSARPNADGKRPFSDVNLDAQPGGIISVLGSAGTARETFMRMILSEEMPESGHISLDGRPVEEFSEARGHGGIVFLDQNPVMFSGTLLENISCFGEGEAIARSLEYSALLGLEKTVHRMPMGYNTVIGPVGEIASSLALMQTVALVRALSLEPAVLLMNDATSAMDDRAVRRLVDCLQSLRGKTTIVLSSGQAMLNDIADQSILLADTRDQDFSLWDEDAELDSSSQIRISSRSA